MTRRLHAGAPAMWPAALAYLADSPREEAQFLSILYAREGLTAGTADPFIRRLWTTFHPHNLSGTDAALTIWYLPAEKKTGFAELFARIPAKPQLSPRSDAAAMGLTFDDCSRCMGWPRRRPLKLLRDLGRKVREKVLP